MEFDNRERGGALGGGNGYSGNSGGQVNNKYSGSEGGLGDSDADLTAEAEYFRWWHDRFGIPKKIAVPVVVESDRLEEVVENDGGTEEPGSFGLD